MWFEIEKWGFFASMQRSAILLGCRGKCVGSHDHHLMLVVILTTDIEVKLQ